MHFNERSLNLLEFSYKVCSHLPKLAFPNLSIFLLPFVYGYSGGNLVIFPPFLHFTFLEPSLMYVHRYIHNNIKIIPTPKQYYINLKYFLFQQA